MPNFSESLPVPYCDVTATCVSPNTYPSVKSVFPVREHISLGICVRGNTYHGETHITVTSQILDNGGISIWSLPGHAFLLTARKLCWRFFFLLSLALQRRMHFRESNSRSYTHPSEWKNFHNWFETKHGQLLQCIMKRFKTIFMNRFYFTACLCIYIYEYVLTLQEVNTLVNAYGVCGYGWAQYLSLLQHCPALLVIFTSEKATGKLCLSLCFHGSVFSPLSGRLRT